MAAAVAAAAEAVVVGEAAEEAAEAVSPVGGVVASDGMSSPSTEVAAVVSGAGHSLCSSSGGMNCDRRDAEEAQGESRLSVNRYHQ